MKTLKVGFKPKICIICKREFIPKQGKQTTCSIECSNQRKRIYNEQYQKENLERVAKWSRNSIRRNKDKVNERAKKRYQKDKNIIQKRNEANLILRKEGIKKEGLCPDCKEYKKLQIHHIDYKNNKFILICEKCHLRRHKKCLYAH
jgi:hypothetical protein